MPDYPPYANGYGKLPTLFKKIQEASVPTKFNQDFLETVLGFKSSSDRAFIGLLKRLGFVDQSNIPTQAYKDYRDPNLSGQVMATAIRSAYSKLFEANAYAYRLDKKDIASTLKRVLGVGDDDAVLPIVVGTFATLIGLANFESSIVPVKSEEKKTERIELPIASSTKLGLSYTIVLNLPPTTDIEVFNAIFKSLKENILNVK
jgi:hypothetical protein